jgi:tRNA-dihydrouridine synthase
MSQGFWNTLPKPFFILAPMYDVTDVAFRHVISHCGPPHVFFTEFVSTDGLMSTGRERLLHHLLKEKGPTPLVAQVFGARSEKFRETAKFIRELGFNGIDINMGCPDKNIIKGGSCAALYRTPELARDIILATKEGAGSMPVSVKIRIGDTKIDWERWIATLLEAKPAAISIHLRTRKEMSKVPAHWELMPEIVSTIHGSIRLEDRPFIIGNGDVLTLKDAREKVAQTNCDGVMIGRGVFQNPWVFAEDQPTQHPLEAKAALLLMHARLYEQYFSDTKPFERSYQLIQ